VFLREFQHPAIQPLFHRKKVSAFHFPSISQSHFSIGFAAPNIMRYAMNAFRHGDALQPSLLPFCAWLSMGNDGTMMEKMWRMWDFLEIFWLVIILIIRLEINR